MLMGLLCWRDTEEPIMSRVLVVHASRHGATAGIAERIAAVLRAQGIEAVTSGARDMADPARFDACVIGAAVYMGSWLKEGTDYLERYASTLATRPVWLFSSGPLPGSTKAPNDRPIDPIENALGPATGPGSGGRHKVEELAARIEPRDHRVFQGAFDPNDSPKSIVERLIRVMPGSKGILPEGDFREWPAIEAWARDIAAAMSDRVVVG
jgi:menaquinone-dependent protoporphyrinogen oxidase